MMKARSPISSRMERPGGVHKGTVVLATVKGDVHDIGKNLVDIILTNNGRRWSTRHQAAAANILAAAEEHRASRCRHVRPAGQIDRIMRENML
jgi:5-methyltetrahydrofolate--homocysteine methyltransferase